MVGLAKLDIQPMAAGCIAAKLLDVLQRRMPVFFRLARAEKIQVRTVQDINARHGLSKCGARPESGDSPNECRGALYGPFAEWKPVPGRHSPPDLRARKHVGRSLRLGSAA